MSGCEHCECYHEAGLPCCFCGGVLPDHPIAVLGPDKVTLHFGVMEPDVHYGFSLGGEAFAVVRGRDGSAAFYGPLRV